MDKQINALLGAEQKRQKEGLVLIASENYVSQAVLALLGSEFTNDYAEGYPGRRYYAGNEYVDKMESLAVSRAKRLFGLAHANVQAYSGSPANLAIISALCALGDPILSQHLSMGGHLSMGQAVSFTSQIVTPHYYGLGLDGDIAWQELEEKARKERPKLIFCGGTAFTKVFDFARYARIADRVGAWFVADVSHIAGLIAGGVHPSPVPFADLVMFTTHKTLRGPRGAVIGVTQKGQAKDPDLAGKIDRAVFPGLQGGPHINNIAALAQALAEANTNEFKMYAKQTVANAKALAGQLIALGYELIGGGTENHMVWIDLRNKGIDGWALHKALELVGIYANKQSIPADPCSPFYPSGIRFGTAAVTTRGMKEQEMKRLVVLIDEVCRICQMYWHKDIGTKDNDKDQKARKDFKNNLVKDKKIRSMTDEVVRFCQEFN